MDEKTRVVSTPAYMHDDARLSDVAVGIDKAVRALLSLARDRRPNPQPGPQAKPAQNQTVNPAPQPKSEGPIVRKRSA